MLGIGLNKYNMNDHESGLPKYWSSIAQERDALMHEHLLIHNETVWLGEQVMLLRDAQRGLRASQTEILEMCIKTIDAIRQLESTPLSMLDRLGNSIEEGKHYLDMMKEELADIRSQVDKVKEELKLLKEQRVWAEQEARALHAAILALYRKDLLMRKKLLGFIPTSTH